MSSVKLLSNLPINDLTPETDYLGLIDKGNLIKSFLIGNKDQFNEIKMFSLYGEWGSGKSSLMKYLEKELKGDFNTYFFEAWEYEKDENLAMSLLEFIDTKSIDSGEKFCDTLLNYGKRIFKGLGKSLKFDIMGAGFELKELIDEFSNQPKLTFVQALEKFKDEFKVMEDRIIADSKAKGHEKAYNIVFIDDLDRCEPEQVLNLLSAIKLFFTYGQRTIFFCGIDKKAVEEAVKTKYGEVVKSNEYLEKIFDISFSMPISVNAIKLVNHFFEQKMIDFGFKEKQDLRELIANFFKEIKFTNPRKLKKVLNKFNLLKNILGLSEEEYLPNIVGDNISYFEIIYTLYLLILHEFYSEIFFQHLDTTRKQSNFQKDYNNRGEYKIGSMGSYVSDDRYNKCEFPLKNVCQINDNNIEEFGFTFCPTNFTKIIQSKYAEEKAIIHKKFVLEEGYEIEGYFFDYIQEYIDFIKNDKHISNCSLIHIKDLIHRLL